MGFIARILSATKGHLGAKVPFVKSPKGFKERSKFKTTKGLRRNKVSTEQLVPSTYSHGQIPRKAESPSNLTKEVNNENLNLRVLLLSPLPTREPVSCEKSTINTSSRCGSVTVEVIRLSGAAGHHFRLDVTSSEDCAHVILPPKFRGNIYIDSSVSSSNAARNLPVHVDVSTELRRSMGAGVVRVNSPAAATKDEDEIHVHAARNVKLQMGAEEIRRGEREKEPVWMLDNSGPRLSRLGRMLKMP